MTGCLLTPLVPVDVGDVGGGSLANAHPLLRVEVVEIHKVVMGADSEVLPIWGGGGGGEVAVSRIRLQQGMTVKSSYWERT